MNNHIENKIACITLLLSGIALLMWFLYPVLSIIPIFCYLIYIKAKYFLKYIILILAGASFGLINFTKVPDSDLQVYYEWVYELNDIGVFEYYSVVGYMDPVFYLTTSILSRFTNASGEVFVLFWTALIYFIGFIAVIKYSQLIKSTKYITVLVLIYMAFVGFNFSLTGHLVRQSVATSFMMLSLVLAIENKNKISYFALLIGILIHFSAIIFLPIIYILNKKRLDLDKACIGILFSTLIAYILGGDNVTNYLRYINFNFLPFGGELGERIILYESKNDGPVGFGGLKEFLLIFVLVTFAVMRTNEIAIKKYFIFAIYFWAILLIFRSNDLMFLRYSMYGYGVFSLGLLIVAKNKYYIGDLIILILSLTSIFRFTNGLQGSNWQYISNDYNLLLLNVNQFLGYF